VRCRGRGGGDLAGHQGARSSGRAADLGCVTTGESRDDQCHRSHDGEQDRPAGAEIAGEDDDEHADDGDPDGDREREGRARGAVHPAPRTVPAGDGQGPHPAGPARRADHEGDEQHHEEERDDDAHHLAQALGEGVDDGDRGCGGAGRQTARHVRPGQRQAQHEHDTGDGGTEPHAYQRSSAVACHRDPAGDERDGQQGQGDSADAQGVVGGACGREVAARQQGHRDGDRRQLVDERDPRGDETLLDGLDDVADVDADVGPVVDDGAVG